MKNMLLKFPLVSFFVVVFLFSWLAVSPLILNPALPIEPFQMLGAPRSGMDGEIPMKGSMSSGVQSWERYFENISKGVCMNHTKADEELVKEGAEKMTGKDVEKVVDKSEDIQRKFYSRGPLKRFVDDAKLLIAMVKDYWGRRYRQVPFGVIGAIVFSLIYVLNPFDLVPDVLPLVGQLDDAAIISACLLLVEGDLLKYKKWREDQS